MYKPVTKIKSKRHEKKTSSFWIPKYFHDPTTGVLNGSTDTRSATGK